MTGGLTDREAKVPATIEPLPVPPEIRSSIRILIVDDEHTLRNSCGSVLRSEGYDVTVCGRGEEALELLNRKGFDLALLDLYMPGISGTDLLRAAMEAKPDTLAVIMTGNPTVSSSIEALRAGAWDYLPKPFTATHLQILIGRAAHVIVGSRQAQEATADRVNRNGHSEKLTILGRSPAFLRAIDLAEKVAKTDASVFITGESGTGKEMIAQYIHHHSRRSNRPMVAVNCAALPETLLESEMFGHCKGAFTGAVRDKPGLLETAHNGTFFLDELTEMAQTIQAKLLRVLQDGVVRRVGSETTDAVVNVRFIAATNRDPRGATEAGMLREDLFYRLSVVPIRVPPLRERPEDIPILAEYFLALYWRRHREKGAPLPVLGRAVMRELQSKPWTGNVRELQNVIEHTVILLPPGQEVQPDDIPFLHGGSVPSHPSTFTNELFSNDEPAETSYHTARDRVVADFELRYLSWLVENAGANMSKAAKIAGVDRTTLYRLMEKHGLHRGTVIKSY